MARTGRPKVNISQNEFELLCMAQCTEEDVADWFHCSIDTVNNWCKKTYGKTFSDIFQQKRRRGFSSMRANIFKSAMQGNTTLMIFWAKNYLGMSDKVEQKVEVNYSDDEAVKEINEFIEKASTEFNNQ